MKRVSFLKKAAGRVFGPAAVILLIGLICSGAVFAVDYAADEGKYLSRGEFALMLLEASGLDAALSPEQKADSSFASVQLLVDKGIIAGYPDGELYLDREITRAEAVTMAAKALGLSEEMEPFPSAAPQLSDKHWGYTFYAWLNHFGLVEGAADEKIDAAEGKAFLQNVFSTDSAALEIVEKSSEAFGEIKTMRSVSDSKITIIPRFGLKEEEGIPEGPMEMHMVQEMVMPSTLYQTTTMVLDLPSGSPQELTTEIYFYDGKLYMKMPDPETGEPKWFSLPEGLIPNLEELMQVEQQGTVIPEGLEDSLFYKLLGTKEYNGEEVSQVAFYGRIDDLRTFMDAFTGQLGESGETLEALVAQGIPAIDSMSFWGVQYVGKDDNMLKGGEFSFNIVFAGEIAGEEPNPLQAMQMYVNIKEYSYNEDLEIVLPPEALDAPSLPGLSELQEQVELNEPEKVE